MNQSRIGANDASVASRGDAERLTGAEEQEACPTAAESAGGAREAESAVDREVESARVAAGGETICERWQNRRPEVVIEEMPAPALAGCMPVFRAAEW